MNEKFKILMLSDHALSTSGVGCQSRFLIEGLIKKGCWSFRQFGAAIKHNDYDTVQVSPDFVIKPIDGFGDRDLIIQTLVSEKPDVLFIFTDPRFFIWLFEIEDEIRQVCPIAYWHVWDNHPMPKFNNPLYEATDLINCHSHMTYKMISEHFPEKTNFIPHSLPPELFKPISKEEIGKYRTQLLGPNKEDHFVLFWVNRNARRKRPADLIWAWSKFMKMIEKDGKKDAILLMHTDPNDGEGPNLLSCADEFDVVESTFFSNQRVDFEQMNVLHNIADCCINISYAEGFGLSTLESMNCAKPIIAVKTGGLTRQVVDHRDGSENGVALDVDFKSLVGSQQVPYIFEDYADSDKIADAIYKMYKTPKDERAKIGEKARRYAHSEFNHQKTIDMWHEGLLGLIASRKKSKPRRWELSEVSV